jgi:hypothetical protein
LVRFLLTPGRFWEEKDIKMWHTGMDPLERTWVPKKNLSLIDDSKIPHFDARFVEASGGEERARMNLITVIESVREQVIPAIIALIGSDFSETQVISSSRINRATQMFFGLLEVMPDDVSLRTTFVSSAMEPYFYDKFGTENQWPLLPLCSLIHAEKMPWWDVTSCLNLAIDKTASLQRRVGENAVYHRIDGSDEEVMYKFVAAARCGNSDTVERPYLCAGEPSGVTRQLADICLEKAVLAASGKKQPPSLQDRGCQLARQLVQEIPQARENAIARKMAHDHFRNDLKMQARQIREEVIGTLHKEWDARPWYSRAYKYVFKGARRPKNR